MPARNHKPAYLLHRPSGQARVRMDGKDTYLGKYNSPESRERYADLIADWLLRHTEDAQLKTRLSLTLDDLALLYLEHAKEYYRKNGEETSEVKCIRTALRFLLKRFGTLSPRKFGPKRLKIVRKQMVAAGWKRTSVNIHVGRIRRMFKWAVSEELIPETVYRALATVDGLRAGRSNAVESIPICPVADHLVAAIEPFVSRPVWGMIRFQRLTGARPGEVTSIRGCDLNMAGGVWEYVPHSHKTEHHGKGRTIFIGPRAQEVLREFLRPDLQAHLFDPREGRAAYLTGVHSNRRRQIGERQAKSHYTAITYAKAVARACIKAKIDHWHPNQLRHAAATEIRREKDLDAARVVLGWLRSFSLP